MLEQLERRAGEVAETRAAARHAALALELREILPKDVRVERGEDGVLISGRGLGRRLMLDASLRWTIAGLLR